MRYARKDEWMEESDQIFITLSHVICAKDDFGLRHLREREIAREMLVIRISEVGMDWKSPVGWRVADTRAHTPRPQQTARAKVNKPKDYLATMFKHGIRHQLLLLHRFLTYLGIV